MTTDTSARASLADALEALASAVAGLESAAEKRARLDDRRLDADEELAAMQDDRARLASELSEALDANKALRLAIGEAARRISAAAALIAKIIDESGDGDAGLRLG